MLGGVRTYRELFRAPEFIPLFLASSVQVAALTMSSLALSTLIVAGLTVGVAHVLHKAHLLLPHP